MVRAEIHLHRYHIVLPRTILRPHLGIAGHQVAGLVFLREERHVERTGRELILCTEDGREELLLECEPADLGINSLAAVTAAADFRGLLVPFLVEIKLRVLGVVLVAFLHPGDDHGVVYVDR